MNPQLAEWFAFTFIDIQNYSLGPYECSTDLDKQVTSWECFGCIAKAETSWPTWGKPAFEHDADCKYVELMKLIGRPW